MDWSEAREAAYQLGNEGTRFERGIALLQGVGPTWTTGMQHEAETHQKGYELVNRFSIEHQQLVLETQHRDAARCPIHLGIVRMIQKHVSQFAIISTPIEQTRNDCVPTMVAQILPPTLAAMGSHDYIRLS
jgi:hypothetical protein